ncbi:MAG: undecaprenyl-phosphate glucose phosphotransferase [Alphaproteobacteria bacterium]|nr:undecaprenyl-phosphate glucose phosphotransferase [Alphaproteobacteria bacterium]
MAAEIETPQLAAEKGYKSPISPAIIDGCIRIFDLIVVGTMGVCVYLFYTYYRQVNFESQYFASIIIATLIAAVIFQLLGAYAGDYIFSRSLRAGRLLVAWTITFGLILTIAFALKITDFYSRLWVVGWFIATAGALTVGRLVISAWILQLARQGRFGQRTLIIGAGEQGQRLAAHLDRRGEIRTRIIGFIDDRTTRVALKRGAYEVLGGVDHLMKLIRRGVVDQVFIALPGSAEDRLRSLICQLADAPIRISIAPDLIGFEFLDRSVVRVAQLPMLNVFERPISGWAQVSKAVEDRILAALLVVFFGPLMLLIALAIKLETRGPVFFRQTRHGFNYNEFRVWKFRTMHAESNITGGAVQAVRGDPRVTRVGRFLRRSSLDELPQLFNVLHGDMSLVGPRPLPIDLTAGGRKFEEVVEKFVARHKVKPGITGWAQVNGWRGETDTIEKIQMRVKYDLYYIENWSIWLDIAIIFRTIVVMFKDDNAY